MDFHRVKPTSDYIYFVYDIHGNGLDIVMYG